MRKFVLIAFVMINICTKANAQFFVGGTLGAGYRNGDASLSLKPTAGYEFNERWAAGLGLGFTLNNDNIYGILHPFIRLNCWNNERFFIDVKASGELVFNSDVCSTLVGFKPSFRYAINDHWQISADIGVLGVDIYDGTCKPAFVFTTTNVEMMTVYRF